MKKGDIKRTQILDAAEKLFFEHGYDRTSVQDILDALDMSKGGFYHYFDAKETVLREISERRALTRFEKLTDDAVTEYLSGAKFAVFGEAPLVAYIAARENEFTAVRIIMTGRMAGLDTDTIRERLREAYV